MDKKSFDEKIKQSIERWNSPSNLRSGTWEGLTDEERENLLKKSEVFGSGWLSRILEAKLRRKNSDYMKDENT